LFSFLWCSFKLFSVVQFYGTQYSSGSFSLINVGSGSHCLWFPSSLLTSITSLHLQHKKDPHSASLLLAKRHSFVKHQASSKKHHFLNATHLSNIKHQATNTICQTSLICQTSSIKQQTPYFERHSFVKHQASSNKHHLPNATHLSNIKHQATNTIC